MEKFGARAELRNILQEKLRGRGANIWRFDSRFVFFGGGGAIVGNATQGACTCLFVFQLVVKRVLTLQPTVHLFSYPAGFRGPCTVPQHYRPN